MDPVIETAKAQGLQIVPGNFGLIPEQQLEQMKRLATMFYNSGLCPAKFENVEQIIVTGLYGRELGLSFMESLKHVHVIEGVPGLDAIKQLAIVRERCKGAKIKVLEQTKDLVRISAWRVEDEGSEAEIFEYSVAEVPQEYFKGNGVRKPKANWVNHQGDMLFARCVTRMIRRKFSDVLSSAYTPEELVESIQARNDLEAPVATGAGGEEVLRTPTGGAPMPRKPREPEAEPEAAQPAPAPEAPAGGVEDPQALEALKRALGLAPDTQAKEFEYDAWRTAQEGKPLTLVEGYAIFEESRRATSAA